jgi:hypothetical protein
VRVGGGKREEIKREGERGDMRLKSERGIVG